MGVWDGSHPSLRHMQMVGSRNVAPCLSDTALGTIIHSDELAAYLRIATLAVVFKLVMSLWIGHK